MIITLVSQGADSGSAVIAANLALLRARAGRRVLLVDADPGQAVARWSRDRVAAGLKPKLAVETILGGELGLRLERLERRFHDIVIHTEGRDTLASRAALISARLAIVPLAPPPVDLQQHYALIARLNAARLFNPGLRVLFVLAGQAQDPGAAAMDALRAYVAQVTSATLAAAIIHAHCSALPDCVAGHCVCQAPERDARAAAEMKGLYREVFVVRLPCAA